jgi:checkpoint serine/threonine-protein kinase
VSQNLAVRVVGTRLTSVVVKTNLESPTGRKGLRRKNSSEPTMTLHTKAATDEIYSIFNQPLKSEQRDTAESDSDYEDDDYTSAGDSTGTGRISGTTSEFGEDETGPVKRTEDETEAASVSEWTEFSSSKHVPKVGADDLENTTDTDAGARIRPTVDATGSDRNSPDLIEELVTPISAMEVSPLKNKFVPLPPEDYEPPRRMYRDEAQMAQNRLPFMTPIVEKTESSLVPTDKRDYFSSKTPSAENVLIELRDEATDDEDVTFVTKAEHQLAVSKSKSPAKPQSTPRKQQKPAVDGNLLSSPFQAIVGTHSPGKTISRKASSDVVSASPSKKFKPSRRPVVESKPPATKGPVIKDTCCNPVDDSIRKTVFQNLQPPLCKYDGYFDHGEEKSGRRGEIEKYSNTVAKMKKSNSDKTMTMSIPPTLRFEDADKTYMIKKCLGKGAFGAVYLAESLEPNGDQSEQQHSIMGKGQFDLHPRTSPLEAIKMEDSPNAWEFYILRTAHRRLGLSRAVDSIVHAYEMHLFRDESFLVEQYRDQGTLLDLINLHKEDAAKGLASLGVMDEVLAMFFTIELFRTVEALHSKGILHGDLKVDNCLIRFDPIPKSIHNGELVPTYSADGKNGWAAKGLSLIDFGRGIDIRQFVANVGFIADWQTRPEDCPEMRELRPWTYQIDYYGLANIIHQMLFGKDIATIEDKSADSMVGVAATKLYKLREPLKRYWEKDIWADVFDVLLNPCKAAWVDGEEGRRMPVLKGMKGVRERMEGWVSAEGERKGLRSAIARLEGRVRKGR